MLLRTNHYKFTDKLIPKPFDQEENTGLTRHTRLRRTEIPLKTNLA